MFQRQHVNRDDLRCTIALLEKDARIYTAWARTLARDNGKGERNGDIAFLKGLAAEHDEVVARLKAASDDDDPPAAEAVPTGPAPMPVQPVVARAGAREEVAA